MATGGIVNYSLLNISTLFSICYLYLYISFIQVKILVINLYSEDVSGMH